MGHFYNLKGEACHEIVGQNGRKRATTIRDASAQGWLPSVTTILDLLSKPGLDRWKHDQIALAVRRTFNSIQSLSDEGFCAAAREEAFKQVEDAADLGTRIHHAIEQWYSGQTCDPAMELYVQAVEKRLREAKVRLLGHELRLVNQQVGYAGTTDCVMEWEGFLGIADFKTRKSRLGYPMVAYDGQATQIAAYHVAHYKQEIEVGDGIVGLNIFISTTEPGRVDLAWHDCASLVREWEFFKHLCRCWQIRNDYTPPIHGR